MYICPKCNHTCETPAKFCTVCGAEMVESNPIPVAEQPVNEQPVASQPITAYTNAPQQPIYAPAPAAGPSKGKLITGMILSIAGIVFAAIGLLYTLIFSLIAGEAGLVMSIVFGVFSLPTSIIGLVLSKSCINAGSASAMCRVGKTLGLIGLILSGASILLGIVFTVSGVGFAGNEFYELEPDYYDYI